MLLSGVSSPTPSWDGAGKPAIWSWQIKEIVKAQNARLIVHCTALMKNNYIMHEPSNIQLCQNGYGRVWAWCYATDNHFLALWETLFEHSQSYNLCCLRQPRLGSSSKGCWGQLGQNLCFLKTKMGGSTFQPWKPWQYGFSTFGTWNRQSAGAKSITIYTELLELTVS